jgi:hypothetical protein
MLFCLICHHVLLVFTPYSSSYSTSVVFTGCFRVPLARACSPCLRRQRQQKGRFFDQRHDEQVAHAAFDDAP